jgi:hypothetical protein
MRGEVEDAEYGRHESKKKMYSTEEVGRRGEAERARQDPKREFKGKIYF